MCKARQRIGVMLEDVGKREIVVADLVARIVVVVPIVLGQHHRAQLLHLWRGQ